MKKARLGWFLAGGLLVALLLAGVVSGFASGSPDGLDAAARQGCTFNADDEITGGTCMAQQEQGHQLAGSPLAGYGIKGIDNEYLSTGLSGVLGVLVTFAIGGGIFWLTRRRGTQASDAEPAQANHAPVEASDTPARASDAAPVGASDATPRQAGGEATAGTGDTGRTKA